MKKTRQKAPLACEDPLGSQSGASGARGQGPGHAIASSGAWRLAVFPFVALFLVLSSCGVKAPPRPRELVVPAPIEDVTVRVVREGIEITFTLPSKSLDGSPLEVIGGYRILREGPDGKDVREDVRFSVSEMRQRVGKAVAFLDEPPARAGTYLYCVVPVDAYGSHPSRRRTVDFCWEGFLSEEREETGGAAGGPPP